MVSSSHNGWTAVEVPVAYETAKRLHLLFDSELRGYLLQDEAADCYQLVSGTKITNEYLNTLIFTTLKNTPVTIENLHSCMNHYHSTIEFISNVHLEHKILSHDADFMDLTTSRAFCELAIRRPIEDKTWERFL